MKTDEVAAVKMAVKRSKKARTCEAGFLSLKNWHDNHKNCDINIVLKCFKKAIRKGIC